MPLVNLHEGFEKSDFPFLDKAGDWGPGCQYEADCTIEQYQNPIPQNAGEGPGWDKDCVKKDDEGNLIIYAVFRISIRQEGERTIRAEFFLETKRSANRLFRNLEALGIQMGAHGAHDTDDAQNMKVIVTSGDPKEKDGIPTYSNVVALTGV